MSPVILKVYGLIAVLLTSSCQAFIDLIFTEPLSEKGEKLLKVISTTSRDCQQTVDACLATAVQIKSLLESQKFCDVFNYRDSDEDGHRCLTGGLCTQAEFDTMKTAACAKIIPISSSIMDLYRNEPLSEKGEKLLKVISTTSKDCQQTVDACLATAVQIKTLLESQKFCDVFNYRDSDEDAHRCLTGGLCTQAEFDTMKTTACEACSLTGSAVLVICSALSQLLKVKA